MAGPAQPSQESRYKNVSYHRRGRVEHGTIRLAPYHLIFSFVPKAAANGAPGSHSHQRGPSGTHTPVTTVHHDTSADTTREAQRTTSGQSAERLEKANPKPRPKEVYVPYPLIHHCTLRPSHTQSSTNRAFGNGAQHDEEDDVQDSFPPTYGTSNSVRPSTDSARLAPYSSPQRPSSPASSITDVSVLSGSGRPPALRIRCKDFQIFALHFHPTSSKQNADEAAREVFFSIRSHCCIDKLEDLYAFHFRPPPEERSVDIGPYDARREFARMGVSAKAADGPGAAWRISDINHDYGYSGTYPTVLGVPQTVSDNMLKYGGKFRSKSRIPALSYLHHNGGSITRCSQPMVGMNKRSPQDEKLVQAIFSSHTPPMNTPTDSPSLRPFSKSAALDGQESADADVSTLHINKSETALNEPAEEEAAPPKPRVYGSTRQNMVADARPMFNMYANKATGGGTEDPIHYQGSSDVPIEMVFCNIQNIHVVRASLQKVVDSLGNSDYLDLAPDQKALVKSDWLKHIMLILQGADNVARVVGLGGSHALVHCSDGWDRTSQLSALAQVMLDPHYRTLDGFIALVQKDFLSFGHKFRERNGIEGCEKWFEIENERIQPTRHRDSGTADANNFQALGSKALTGAKNFIQKGRGGFFQKQNASHDSLADHSRPASPPPNPVIHSIPSTQEKKPHKMKPDEVAPIFHQFLDCVYQLLYQSPAAFGFNERFLRRLYYQVYAGQYGEFLFDNEKERSQYQDKVPSVWSYFLARRKEFSNPEYAVKEHDALLLPRKRGGQIEVRWWNELFGRKDEEMNTPQALLVSEPSDVSTLVDDTSMADIGSSKSVSARAKSTPNLNLAPEEIGSRTNMASDDPGAAASDHSASAVPSRPTVHSHETDDNILAQYAGLSTTGAAVATQSSRSAEQQASAAKQDDSDPLGVSSAPHHRDIGRPDFAAFAQQNAFRD